LSRAKIVLATSNRGKVREIEQELAGLPVAVLSLEEIGSKAGVEEKGRTFRENARLKAIAYSLESEHLTLAEDSGLEVGHLGGAPGIFSARFSAPRPTDEKNNRKLLRMLRGVPESERGARYVCHVVLAKGGRVIKETRGEVRGRIAASPKGEGGFGYDPIFFYAPFGRTFGELPPETKNSVSHRGRALAKMRAFLADYLHSPSPSPKKEK
jgi:XTP/dITP diphosphohydrolase